jgi:hypothetical protein
MFPSSPPGALVVSLLYLPLVQSTVQSEQVASAKGVQHAALMSASDCDPPTLVANFFVSKNFLSLLHCVPRSHTTEYVAQVGFTLQHKVSVHEAASVRQFVFPGLDFLSQPLEHW